MENDQSALDAFKKATHLKPTHALAHYELGLSYLKLKDVASAISEYHILSELNQTLATKLYDAIPEGIQTSPQNGPPT